MLDIFGAIIVFAVVWAITAKQRTNALNGKVPGAVAKAFAKQGIPESEWPATFLKQFRVKNPPVTGLVFAGMFIAIRFVTAFLSVLLIHRR